MKGVLQTEVPERAPPRPQVPFGRNQGCEVSLVAVSPLCPEKPPAGCGMVGEFPPSLASLPPQRHSARVCVCVGGHHVETEQGSHAQLSI